MREVVLYSRRGCHLCDEMLELIEPLCRGRATIVINDVDERDDWQGCFGLDVPVLYVDGVEVCRHVLNRDLFMQALQR